MQFLNLKRKLLDKGIDDNDWLSTMKYQRLINCSDHTSRAILKIKVNLVGTLN